MLRGSLGRRAAGQRGNKEKQKQRRRVSSPAVPTDLIVGTVAAPNPLWISPPPSSCLWSPSSWSVFSGSFSSCSPIVRLELSLPLVLLFLLFFLFFLYFFFFSFSFLPS